MQVWPLPAAAALGPAPDGVVAVDRGLVLRTTPSTFQQQTCRHFLAKAFARFQGALYFSIRCFLCVYSYFARCLFVF